MEFGQGPRSGARDNGLRCSSYVVIGDLDPRIADSLLDTLRSEGIAAYVTPTPSTRGGYLEMQVPSKLTDRLFADAERADDARGHLPEPDPTQEIDFDSAWQQVLTSLQTPSSDPVPRWPVSEDVDPAATTSVPVDIPLDAVYDTSDPDDAGSGDPALDEHFEPPPPPPLPRLQRVTIVSLLAIAAGVLILVVGFDGGSLTWLAILAILSGVATLVWHMKDGPPIDSGWDDGAIL